MTGKGRIVEAAQPASAKAADLEAFVIVHYPRLIRLAGMVTHEVDAAQDAVQTALERAWRHRAELGDGDRLRPWLDRIVVREAIRQSSRNQTWLSRLVGRSRVTWLDLAAEPVAPADAAVDATDRAALRAAFIGLSAGHRAVVALHLYAGYSVDETARFLGVPVDTVRSRLRAARKRMRHAMSEVAS